MSLIINKGEKVITQQFVNELSYEIIGSAIEVHKHIGPGLLESVYHACLFDEMTNRGLDVKSQVYVPVHYKGKNLGGTLKIDLLVNDIVIIEIKAAEVMIPVFKAQLLSYLKLANKPKGLLINFNCEVIKDNMTSLVTEEFRKLPKA